MLNSEENACDVVLPWRQIMMKRRLGLVDGQKMLSRLVKVVRRRSNRLLDAMDGGDRQEQETLLKQHRRQAWAETARTQYQANAAAVQSDQQIISKLEDLVAARIGKPVRHSGSEPVLRAGSGTRAHAHRRAYTRHRFDVSGTPDEKLARLLDADGVLCVFVKSGSRLGLSPQLEFTLSEQGGQGFRAPYFFGSFTASDLTIGVWESVRTDRRPFPDYDLEDQVRIVEAIAAANAVRVDRAVPVMARWVTMKPPRWFKSRYRSLDGEGRVEWQDLYGRTLDVMRHQKRVRRLCTTGELCLTHNDVASGGNIHVPPTGDVVVYDWEVSTLSSPGADLGVLSPVDSSPYLLSCYLSRMAEYRFRLNADAVRWTADVVDGHRSLYVGWHRQDAGQVERSLALLTRYLHD